MRFQIWALGLAVCSGLGGGCAQFYTVHNDSGTNGTSDAASFTASGFDSGSSDRTASFDGPDASSVPLACAGPASQACGNCGTQTHTCNAGTGMWSAWSACTGEGTCMPGASQMCGNGGVQSCDAACAWGACGKQTCPGSPSQACGNCGTQTRVCDPNTGVWSAFTACTGEGTCKSGSTQGCGNGGHQTCSGSCQWGACGGQTCNGPSSQGCGNCGNQNRNCDPNTGQWSNWSGCNGQGACASGSTQGCGNGGRQMCGGNCQWGACGNQMCGGSPTLPCGNCGTQTRTCDTNTGNWSGLSACGGQGCAPGTTQTCGNGGQQMCGGNCQWGACNGQTCNGPTTQACKCGGVTQTRQCNNGNWSDFSPPCPPSGACCDGDTKSCANNCGVTGNQTCSNGAFGACSAAPSGCCSDNDCGMCQNCNGGTCKTSIACVALCSNPTHPCPPNMH